MRAPVSIAIVVGDDCWGGLALLAREAFAIAGTLHARNADLRAAELFRARLVAIDRAPVRSFTGPSLQPEATLADMPAPQAVIVPPYYLPLSARQPIASPLRGGCCKPTPPAQCWWAWRAACASWPRLACSTAAK